jgi:hypothetical protein
LDTRNKIVKPQAIPPDGTRITLITGYFDPVYAATSRRLENLCGPEQRIVVAVADPPEPLLPWRARAELVAALGCVDYVIAADEAVELDAASSFDERDGDLKRKRELVEHILERHRTA